MHKQLSGIGDHPRSRGKDFAELERLGDEEGSPPLAREGLFLKELKENQSRITPARAGRTLPTQ